METITIPKREYELLLKVKKTMELDIEERFNKRFLESVNKSLKDLKEGKGKIIRNKKELREYFRAM